MKKEFTKMHGCGNNYIYFNCLEEMIDEPNALSIRLADRNFGIGSDGIILICPSDKAPAKMRIFNADGSEAKMCGNGIRCVGQYLYDHGIVTDKVFDVDTLSGIKHIKICDKLKDKNQVQVDMGAPILEPVKIPVSLEGDVITNRLVPIGEKEYAITCVSMGNPHCVVFQDELENLELEKIGPVFEKHVIFPEQVNTEFVKVIDDKTLQMRVWERGSGETFACGTGACAVVVAAVMNGFCKKNEEITVQLTGGDLKITYTDETVFMTGEAETICEGVVEL